jgi:hypothetical protein
MVTFGQWLESFLFESRFKIHVKETPHTSLPSSVNMGEFCAVAREKIGREERQKNIVFLYAQSATFLLLRRPL